MEVRWLLPRDVASTEECMHILDLISAYKFSNQTKILSKVILLIKKIIGDTPRFRVKTCSRNATFVLTAVPKLHDCCLFTAYVDNIWKVFLNNVTRRAKVLRSF